jgi:hypothetical protein
MEGKVRGDVGEMRGTEFAGPPSEGCKEPLVTMVNCGLIVVVTKVIHYLLGVVTMVTCPEKEENIYPNMHHCAAIKKWAHSAMDPTFLLSNTDGYRKDFKEFKEVIGITKDKFLFVSFRDFIAAQEVWLSFTYSFIHLFIHSLRQSENQ